jgi:single-strand DNA-binding protein
MFSASVRTRRETAVASKSRTLNLNNRVGARKMAEGLNRVMLLGNLGADPELRNTSGGQAVLKLRLATTESYLDRNRARQERTEWHSVVVWGRRAEALSRILSKGSRLFVEGGIRTSTYDDKDGNKRYRTEVVANNIILAGSAPSSGPRSAAGAGRTDFDASSPAPAPSAAPAAAGGGFDDADYGGGGTDDDFPF